MIRLLAMCLFVKSIESSNMLANFWFIKIKERGSVDVLETEYLDTSNKMTEQDLVKFYSLDEPDVEWYSIELLNKVAVF